MDISTGSTVSVSTASVSMKKAKGKLYRSIKYQPPDYFSEKNVYPSHYRSVKKQAGVAQNVNHMEHIYVM